MPDSSVASGARLTSFWAELDRPVGRKHSRDLRGAKSHSEIGGCWPHALAAGVRRGARSACSKYARGWAQCCVHVVSWMVDMHVEFNGSSTFRAQGKLTAHTVCVNYEMFTLVLRNYSSRQRRERSRRKRKTAPERRHFCEREFFRAASSRRGGVTRIPYPCRTTVRQSSCSSASSRFPCRL